MVNSGGGGNSSSSIVVGDGGGGVVDRPAATNKDRLTQPKNGSERSRSPSSGVAMPSLPRESGSVAARTTADGGGVVLRFSSSSAAIDEREDDDAMTATTAATVSTERARGVYCSLPLEKVLCEILFSLYFLFWCG